MMFFIICMLGACTAEELAGPESGVEDDAPVVIAISPADITSVNMNSRAAGDNSIFCECKSELWRKYGNRLSG